MNNLNNAYQIDSSGKVVVDNDDLSSLINDSEMGAAGGVTNSSSCGGSNGACNNSGNCSGSSNQECRNGGNCDRTKNEPR